MFTLPHNWSKRRKAHIMIYLEFKFLSTIITAKALFATLNQELFKSSYRSFHTMFGW